MTFEQGDESHGVAWATFMHLVESGPPHQIPEEILMLHFIYGLKPESGSALNIIFAKTLEDMGFDMTKLVPSDQAFYGIIPGAGSTPVDKVCRSFTIVFSEV